MQSTQTYRIVVITILLIANFACFSQKTTNQRHFPSKWFQTEWSNDTLSVIELLKLGTPIDTLDNSQRSLLGNAVDRPNNIEFVRFLLQKGADVNLLDQHENSPIVLAAETSGNLKMVELLVEQGADVKGYVDRYGNTILHNIAVGYQQLDTLIWDYLITQDADINALNHRQQHPMLAMLFHNEEISVAELGFFVRRGVDVHAFDSDGKNALMYALYNQQTDLATELLYLGALSHMNEAQLGEMATSTMGWGDRKERMVRLLQEFGAPLHFPDYNGNTLLLEVAEEGLASIFFELIGKDLFDPMHIAKDGKGLLIKAAKGGNFQVVEYVLSQYPELAYRKDTLDRTALFHAVINQEKASLDIVTLLCDTGQLVNAQDSRNKTPIEYACDRNNPEVLAYMLQQPELENDSILLNKTFLTVFSAEMTQIFLESGYRPNTQTISRKWEIANWESRLLLLEFKLLKDPYSATEQTIPYRAHRDTINNISGRYVSRSLNKSMPLIGSILDLYADGTYKMQSHGCLISSYSKGNWQVRQGEISLTSFSQKTGNPIVVVESVRPEVDSIVFEWADTSSISGFKIILNGDSSLTFEEYNKEVSGFYRIMGDSTIRKDRKFGEIEIPYQQLSSFKLNWTPIAAPMIPMISSESYSIKNPKANHFLISPQEPYEPFYPFGYVFLNNDRYRIKDNNLHNKDPNTRKLNTYWYYKKLERE